MFAPIFSACAHSAAARAVLGTDPFRLFPFGRAPQGVAMPYATWQGIGGAPENYLGQRPDMDQFALQVDVYADDVNDARAAARALRDAIEPHAHITRWGGEETDSTTGACRINFDVDWFVPR